MLLAAHQPDFLPYSGFWWKMWKADLFDLAVWDQYSSSGYHSRVKVGPDSEWLSLKVPRKRAKGKPIVEVTFDFAESRERVARTLWSLYWSLPYGRAVRDLVIDAFDRLQLDGNEARLWELNTALIYGMKDWLGIDTQIATARPLTRPKDEGILELCEFYGADEYLSGTGARAYLDPERFERAGVKLHWSTHRPITQNSMIEVMAMTSEPMEVVCCG